MLFSFLFWLGYCNSAINPFIYAMFSKDFRFAFKRVIYRCFCSKKYLEEHKFHVLHRFVPFPFAAGLAGTAQRPDLNFDIARWRSFTPATALNANTMRNPIMEICHPIVITNLSSAPSNQQTGIAATAPLNELPSTCSSSSSSANLFRSKSARIPNSITKLWKLPALIVGGHQ